MGRFSTVLVQSIKRATDIISLFTPSRSRLGPSEIAKALNLHRGTAWGLVSSLEQCGLLEKDADSGKYRLGPKVYEWGMIYARGLEINHLAVEPLSRLVTHGSFRANLGIWDDSSILVTLTVLSRTMTPTAGQIGPRLVAYCTALGKAVLAYKDPDEVKAYLDRTELTSFTSFTITKKRDLLKEFEGIRKQGYAIDREEYVIGVGAIAAPVFDKNGRAVATISVGGNPNVVLGERMEELAGGLRSAASEISNKMGYAP